MIAQEGVKAELWAEKWYDCEFIGGRWNLAYTTEKEVLSLIGDPGSGAKREIRCDKRSGSHPVDDDI